MIGVSGCLAGIPCRYDGKSKPNAEVEEMVKVGEAKTFCPECLAGLKIPRSPSEIAGGDGLDVLSGKARVISEDGQDRTAEFILAAEKSLAFCKKHGITKVLMKAKSPSCGKTRIYDGTFSGTLRPGTGVAAAYLMQNGVEIVEID
jgi:uncharacterized protein YbbK (DUF523 family)